MKVSERPCKYIILRMLLPLFYYLHTATLPHPNFTTIAHLNNIKIVYSSSSSDFIASLSARKRERTTFMEACLLSL